MSLPQHQIQNNTQTRHNFLEHKLGNPLIFQDTTSQLDICIYSNFKKLLQIIKHLPTHFYFTHFLIKIVLITFHTYKSYNEEKRPHKCSICDATFPKPSYLKYHVAKKHEGKKPFNCSLCDARYFRKERLDDHIISFHEGIKKFDCKMCDQKYVC